LQYDPKTATYQIVLADFIVDSVGLDTVEHIEQHYVKDRNLPASTLSWLHDNYIKTGKLGNKSDKGGLYPPPTAGNRTKLIVLNINPGTYPGEIPMNKLLSSGQILEISIDEKMSIPNTLATEQKLPDGIDICDGRMYWTAMGVASANDGTVLSAKLDGSDIRTVVPVGEVHTPKQLHIDQKHRKLYFGDREGLRVHRCNLDGTDHEVVVQTGAWQSEPGKVADETYWPVGVTVSNKLERLYWTQKGPSKSNHGRIFSAPLELPAGCDAATRTDIELVASGLPEPIDLEVDDEEGVLYWTDRGEIPFGNTLNKKQISGTAPDAEGALGREIIAQGFGEAIGLRLDKARGCIYVADITGRLWECGTMPGPKKLLSEVQGHSFTGLAFMKY
jgi:DNA-binding beta-propeller fold protein YncE